MTPNIPSNPNNIPVTSGDGIMALFDFKFGKFISPSLIRWLYVALLILLTIICIVMELGSVIGFLGSLFDKNKPTGLLFLLIIINPIFYLVSLVSIRIGLERLMAIFNIERLTRHIEENTRKT